MVGAAVSKDLQQKGWISLIFVCIAIMIYVWIRFDFSFGVGALASLFHDLVIVTGILAVTGREIEMPVLAALLTLLGYSINDTIVVYDRVRENLRKGVDLPLPELLSTSISQTLSRTMLTSGLTLVAMIALFFLGGEVLHNFAFTMVVGIIFGTYSSILIACPIMLLVDRRHRKV
jgi:preprotein translocase subunit SecF